MPRRKSNGNKFGGRDTRMDDAEFDEFLKNMDRLDEMSAIESEEFWKAFEEKYPSPKLEGEWTFTFLTDDPKQAIEAIIAHDPAQEWLRKDYDADLNPINRHPSITWMNWDELKKMQPGDRLEFFRSPDSHWEYLVGREGYRVMRGDEVVACVRTGWN